MLYRFDLFDLLQRVVEKVLTPTSEYKKPCIANSSFTSNLNSVMYSVLTYMRLIYMD